MSRYRRKPPVIEARQLTRKNGAELWEWAESKPHYATGGTVDGLTIYTPEGRVKAEFGDWIVKNTQGHFYPVKPEIFEAAYEPAEGNRSGALHRIVTGSLCLLVAGLIFVLNNHAGAIRQLGARQQQEATQQAHQPLPVLPPGPDSTTGFSVKVVLR